MQFLPNFKQRRVRKLAEKAIFPSSVFSIDHILSTTASYFLDIKELEKMVWDMKRSINMLSSKLVRLLKQRDRHAHKIQDNFNILTALLQAVSQKRSELDFIYLIFSLIRWIWPSCGDERWWNENQIWENYYIIFLFCLFQLCQFNFFVIVVSLLLTP